MIGNISLRFGESSGGGGKLSFDPKSITIFVGPNNSGKSLVLREIEKYLENTDDNSPKLNIIEDVRVNEIDGSHIDEFCRTNIIQESHVHGYVFGFTDLVSGSQKSFGHWTKIDQFQEQLKSHQNSRNKYAWLNTLILDGAMRLRLTDEKPFTDLMQSPGNTHAALLQNKELRNEIRETIFNSFGVYLTIDPTAGKSIRIRVSDVKPPEDLEDRLHKEAVIFHSQAKLITELGDGIKAFAGILIATLCTKYKIVLLDEPEAFLHPPLAYRLGRELSKLAVSGQSNLFVSTHSANYLLGCLESGKEINIVRLTYKQGIPTARLLPSADVIELVKNPYVRSAGILSAIFHDGAIVTENDTDRVFYQEINYRLERANMPYARDVQFLNVNGKTGMYRIVAPLRRLGVPVAPIVDFDILDNGAEFGSLLNACNLPESTASGVKRQREELIDQIRAAIKNQKGVDSFESEDRNAIRDLLDVLSKYGLFVVPFGALESWLPELGISAPKRHWLEAIFQNIGENPEDDNYLPPQDGGVWEFLSRVGTWIADPNRRGMPI